MIRALNMYRRNKKKNQPNARISSAEFSRAAFSYNVNRSQIKIKDSKGRVDPQKNEYDDNKVVSSTRSRKRLVLLVFIIVSILLCITLYSGSNPRIIIIQPNGFNYLPHTMNDYKQEATRVINSSLYNHIKLTVSSKDIGNNLINIFPEIDYAGVAVPLIGINPTVYIQLTEPCLIFSTGSNSYIVDSNGDIIGNSSMLSSKMLASMPTVILSYSVHFTDGYHILSPANVIFIQQVKDAFAAKNIVISKMELVPGVERLDVYPGGTSYYIKFNMNETDALQQVGTYLATISTLKKENITPSQYINVMVDGRAYYK